MISHIVGLFLACFTISLALTALIIKTARLHVGLTSDNLDGPQKVHKGHIPRIGGIAVFCSFAAIGIWWHMTTPLSYGALLLAAIPAFMIGLIEDTTKQVSPAARLLVALFSGLVFVVLTDITLRTTAIPFLDTYLQNEAVATFVTVLAIATMVNAINITDGLNGLSLGTSAMIALSCAYIAHQLGDNIILTATLMLVAASAGLLIFNFPAGRIFLGDGGAYFIGATLAMFAIMLSEANAAISPFASLLLVLYPLYELLRSFVRRAASRSKKVMMPDHDHFHSIAYRNVCANGTRLPFNHNASAAVITLSLPAFCCLSACYFYNNQMALIICCAIFIALYEIGIWRLGKSA